MNYGCNCCPRIAMIAPNGIDDIFANGIEYLLMQGRRGKIKELPHLQKTVADFESIKIGWLGGLRTAMYRNQEM
jgi:hypothetical protein